MRYGQKVLKSAKQRQRDYDKNHAGQKGFKRPGSNKK